jgi:two-component system, cell cycle sensor histidine kinase and response regulator CckA
MVSAALIADYGEVLVILKDVTEQRQREAHMRQNDKLAALGGMVAGAAHELNNPLATILGLAQLQIGATMPAELRSDLEAIERAALRARSIVQQLLRFASPQQPQTEPVALGPLIAETLDRLKQALRASDVQIMLDIAPNLPPTLGDRHQLEQVLFNIFQNAAQSLSANSPDLPRQLHIRAIQESGVLQLTIEDTGPGIPLAHLSRIFDPFFTTRPIGQGPGLGLAICHTIIQQHDGRIWAQSPPGKGAMFVIQLPISHLS